MSVQNDFPETRRRVRLLLFGHGNSEQQLPIWMGKDPRSCGPVRIRLIDLGTSRDTRRDGVRV